MTLNIESHCFKLSFLKFATLEVQNFNNRNAHEKLKLKIEQWNGNGRIMERRNIKSTTRLKVKVPVTPPIFFLLKTFTSFPDFIGEKIISIDKILAFLQVFEHVILFVRYISFLKDEAQRTKQFCVRYGY